MICGWASVHGYQVGIVGNNGPIYPDVLKKLLLLFNFVIKRNIPLIFYKMLLVFWLVKILKGKAIIKKGSQLINSVSNSMVPHITIIIGASYGAGTYAMSGKLTIIVSLSLADRKNSSNGSGTDCTSNVYSKKG
jgi:acetyl-CoA carboxylase carboxyltransferase component